MKQLKIAALGIGIVLALLQVYNIASDFFTGNLEAVVRYGEFTIPDILNKEHENAFRSLWLDSLHASASSILNDPDNAPHRLLVYAILDTLNHHLRNQFSDEVHNELKYSGGYWSVRVTNNTSRATTSVVLNLPSTKFVRIQKEGADPDEHFSNQVVVIGSLQPRQSVAVFAWTRITPSEYDIDNVRITHEAGVGKIVTLVPTGWLGQLVDGPLFKVILLIVVFAFLTYPPRLERLLSKFKFGQ